MSEDLILVGILFIALFLITSLGFIVYLVIF